MEFNATFIVAFVSFIIFTVIMNLILYKPICEIVLKRKQFIDSNYDEANSNSEKIEAIKQDKVEKITKANEDAKSVIAEKTHEANSKKEEIMHNARIEASKNIDAYNLYYKNATKEAKEYLKMEVLNLAQSISDKFLPSDEKISIEISDDEFEEVMQG